MPTGKKRSNAKAVGLRSDAQLLRWLRDNIEWDGHGYWLPEICIREIASGQDNCPEPTLAEFRAALSERARACRS